MHQGLRTEQSDFGLKFDEQTKVKVPWDLFVHWVEKALSEVNQKQRLKQEIRKMFSKCGLDPYDDDKLLFAHHIESLGMEALYKALTDAQTSAQLL